MNKTILCTPRTINLAKTKPNLRPKTKTLIFEKPQNVKSAPFVPTPAPPVQSVPVTRLKMCSKEQLKKMQGRNNVSPWSKKPPIGGRFFASTVNFGLKTGFAALLVYWTYALGLWGDSTQSTEFLTNILNVYEDAVKQFWLKYEDIKYITENEEEGDSTEPVLTEFRQGSFLEIWNRAVLNSFSKIMGYTSPQSDTSTPPKKN